MKKYSITIGNKMWLVLSDKKPTVKEEKEIRGLKFNKVIIDEVRGKNI